ncbi:MAG TPA: bifunctional YncE family protein/alkaline phosphatase family protein, partial [Chitinophagales bacterium]|nr:bifunctional YncE family protein/alkaline phosphatase family protein [Chitinophagales bacterium]
KTVSVSWYGLAFSDDSKTLYTSGGNGNWVLRWDIKNNKLELRDTIVIGKPWPEKISVAGIAIDDAKHLLYAVTKENNSLYVIDVQDKKVLKQLPLGGEGYTCLLSPDKKTLYATCWGCDKVVLFDCEKQELKGVIPVGDNPNDMALTKDGGILYVANSNDNSVSVIDVKKNKVVEVLNAALFPDAPSGSTTNGLALTPDEKTLYIANADNNCLAVFDVSTPGKSKSKGFIPTGWYPTGVKVVGNYIFVLDGKGFRSLPNPRGPNPVKKKQKVVYQQGDPQKPNEVQYIAGLFKGMLGIIQTPTAEQLDAYTQVVYRNAPYKKDRETETGGRDGNPIPHRVGDASPIKYVFYIIKENRTYDQVLGDVKNGNGDTALVLFGNDITPNQHAIVNDFVLLDNFYVDGTVSADGHNWSTGAYATDYLEKNWPTNYGGRGGSYDGEGEREIANDKNFIWDMCHKYGVTYRTYAEFVEDGKANIPSLDNHFCDSYTGWVETVMDTTRCMQWQRDFDSLLAINQVPHFNTLRFVNDHTHGLKVGGSTPFANVADNDLAVGMFVEHLSKSPIWNQSVVFILEDDAQNGPDHIDAHRSTAYIAGGYVKRNYVDHTTYSTSSMLRTMELILGLPPMSQYDAAAEPMWRCFSDTANPQTYTVVPEKIDLLEKNTAMNEWEKKSEQFDFNKEDKVPDEVFNEVLWRAVKGSTSALPPPKHAAFILANNDNDKDGD